MSDDGVRELPASPPTAPAPASPAAAHPSSAPQATTLGASVPADPSSPVALLEALARALPPETIDELWIFPARRLGAAAQSTVIVASAFEAATGAPPVAQPPAAEEPGQVPGIEVPSDRRRIITARFTLAGDPRTKQELHHELAEHGAAPAERVGRVVDGVVRRLDDEPEPPRHARIGGDTARWTELLQKLGSNE